MKLVLLPGMDGRGDLFSSLIAELSEIVCEVISLPQVGKQDYISLAAFVKARLPAEDFILLAESFSGPIGAVLAAEGLKHIKGVIFVATFLSPPSPPLLFLASRCPGAFLSYLPFSGYFYRKYLIGSDASCELVEQIKTAIRNFPPVLMKARIRVIARLLPPSLSCDLVPALYIRPSADRLVQPHKVKDFKRAFKKLSVKEIDGPHFILQAESKLCAGAIVEFMAQC